MRLLAAPDAPPDAPPDATPDAPPDAPSSRPEPTRGISFAAAASCLALFCHLYRVVEGKLPVEEHALLLSTGQATGEPGAEDAADHSKACH